MKFIFMLSVVLIAILAFGDSNNSGDKGSPIIHRVETVEPVKGERAFPEVPEGFPPDLKSIVVWLAPNYQKGDKPDHEIMYRVLIELWNQGDHDFVNVVGDGLPLRKVYPIYPEVVYVQWRDHKEPGPDGELLKYISFAIGARDAVKFTSKVNGDEFKHLTEAEMKEMMTGEGAYMAQYPGLKLVDYRKSGYKPKDILVDYCNQPGNRARVPYCR
ncbi:MAG: hypothetical protein OXP71_08125 [Candidatus Poribacteria bacterium]|nr:hypothetical protein [Candidatus Poribacteria bacterium]